MTETYPQTSPAEPREETEVSPGTVQLNKGRRNEAIVDGRTYRILAIKTRRLEKGDDLPAAVEYYASPLLEPGDTIFMSEKMVGATQGRVIPLEDIKPSRLATTLSRFVYKNPGGIGLAMPETMEMALREVGRPRILFAAAASAVGKLFRQRGWFYRIAGRRAASIDGPTPYTLPPFNRCVSLSPLDPDAEARKVSERVGVPALVVDVNDLGGVILGASSSDVNRELMVRILKGNPLGQETEQTPIGIIRAID